MSDLQHGAPGDYDDPAGGPIYEERRGLSPLARMLVLAAIAIAVAALAGLVWFAYSEGVRSGAEDAAPVLRADTAPVKRKPEDAGGMAIPHQDKLVYNRIAPGQAQQPVERLLPRPETPVDRPAPPAEPPAEPAAVQPAVEPPPTMAKPAAEAPAAGQSADATAQAVVEAGKAAMADKPAPGAGGTPFVRTPELPAPQPPAPQPPALPPAPEPTAAAPQQVAAPAPPPLPAPPSATDGPAWRIQLASVTSDEAARKEWERLQKANDDLLGKLALNVQTVSLAKGTYHRIQAGPLADRGAATTLCDALKARKQDCLVVTP
jgi:cell division septation protein DedD